MINKTLMEQLKAHIQQIRENGEKPIKVQPKVQFHKLDMDSLRETIKAIKAKQEQENN